MMRAPTQRHAHRGLVLLAALLACFTTPWARGQDYINTTLADNPLGFWTLSSNNAASLVNGYSSTYVNGATTSAPGTGVPLADYPNNAALSMNGSNSTPQYATTGLSGGINGTGSIVAWVNLAELPSTAGAYFYVAGESQFGNDFDLQFQNDNKLYFYTGSGENTSYAPNTSTLIGQWNQIVVTYAGGSSGFRDIYWDGTLVASYNGSVSSASKSSVFTIGYSSVFSGRDFDGLVGDVAVFGSPLSSGQVSQLYAATAVPEPSACALLGTGLAGIALVAKTRRKRSHAGSMSR